MEEAVCLREQDWHMIENGTLWERALEVLYNIIMFKHTDIGMSNEVWNSEILESQVKTICEEQVGICLHSQQVTQKKQTDPWNGSAGEVELPWSDARKPDLVALVYSLDTGLKQLMKKMPGWPVTSIVIWFAFHRRNSHCLVFLESNYCVKRVWQKIFTRFACVDVHCTLLVDHLSMVRI